jgi:hypothetical protein
MRHIYIKGNVVLLPSLKQDKWVQVTDGIVTDIFWTKKEIEENLFKPTVMSPVYLALCLENYKQPTGKMT